MATGLQTETNVTNHLLHQSVSLCHSRSQTSFDFSHLFRALELDGHYEAAVVAATVVVVAAVVVLVVLRDARRG